MSIAVQNRAGHFRAWGRMNVYVSSSKSMGGVVTCGYQEAPLQKQQIHLEVGHLAPKRPSRFPHDAPSMRYDSWSQVLVVGGKVPAEQNDD